MYVPFFCTTCSPNLLTVFNILGVILFIRIVAIGYLKMAPANAKKNDCFFSYLNNMGIKYKIVKRTFQKYMYYITFILLF